ncbi:MAG TPA: ribbon-helix-helix protein, CopG family [Bryobacteraceae bacterium]|nr:ribbon-helix-helix protein, CopG family [Bryobacteraceae bacterium]
MAAIKVHMPADLLAGLEAKAAASGKTVEELAEEALRARLNETSWENLLAYGHERGRLAGFTEEQPAEVVNEWRKEQRG